MGIVAWPVPLGGAAIATLLLAAGAISASVDAEHKEVPQPPQPPRYVSSPGREDTMSMPVEFWWFVPERLTVVHFGRGSLAVWIGTPDHAMDELDAPIRRVRLAHDEVTRHDAEQVVADVVAEASA